VTGLTPGPAALFDLTGKVALVTGGSRGLGREIVVAFANAGADVVIASRKLDNCKAVAEEVEAAARRALPVACHVGHWDECAALADRAYEHFGKVDILVNNAGMSPLAPSSEQTSEELFDKVIGVNFKGPFRLSALIGQRMYDGEGGSIINVSSSGALFPAPRFGPYAGAKAALNALTTVFAREFGPRVRVNTLSAGPFLTDIAKHWPDESERTWRSAAGRAGAPEEVVTTALYLASPASSYTTGSLIRVDGGLYLPARAGQSAEAQRYPFRKVSAYCCSAATVRSTLSPGGRTMNESAPASASWPRWSRAPSPRELQIVQGDIIVQLLHYTCRAVARAPSRPHTQSPAHRGRGKRAGNGCRFRSFSYLIHR
jgi:NAD(P)-dependent dehydrogenase (short-subunit alcohol dehydrogenase family)